jgi:ribosomal-protein-alanine N-acetyltransferase
VLQGLISTARQRGAHYATLEVSTANTAAQGLYGAAGFQEAGVRRGYYRNGEDALIQWLRLNG